MPIWHLSKPRIPAAAVALSAVALAVPIAASLWPVGPLAFPLIWLLALIPAFVLGYYRGSPGVAAAAVSAVVAMAVTHFAVRGDGIAEWALAGVAACYVATCLGIGWLSDALHRSRAQAEVLALTDELTGIANRRRMRMFLREQLATRRGSVAAVIFDLDNFKLYNDEHGHPAGDVMLRTFANVLTSNLPVGAMAGRYGGEEFLVIVPNCDEAGAVELAQRIRVGMQAAQATADPLTVCAGVADTDGGDGAINELIVAADRALYRAKQNGRDCVTAASKGS